MFFGMTRRLAIAVALLALGGSARADFMITGNPVTDSDPNPMMFPDYWRAAGNSLAFGKYIRGDGNFSFDMYRSQFLVNQASLSPTLTLQADTGWLGSDSVIGLGGVIVTTLPSGFSTAYTGDAINTNLSPSVRIISKFNMAGVPFTASTVAPDQGNGLGSFSAGDGGTGSILIATDIGQVVTQTTSSPLTVAEVNQRWNGTMVVPITNQNARFIYKTDSMGILTSWEVFLNTSRLGRELTSASSPNTVVPTWDGHWNQSLQRGTNDFTDAVNQHMPLPPTLVALVAGAGLLGLGRRLRRAA